MSTPKRQKAAVDKITGLRTSRIIHKTFKEGGTVVRERAGEDAHIVGRSKTRHLVAVGRNYGEGSTKTEALHALKESRASSAVAAKMRHEKQRRDRMGRFA